MNHSSFYVADFTVEELARLVKEQQIVVPGFQRGYVWSKTEASRFIESLLMGIPVTPIVLIESKEQEAYEIIDGQQRLTSIHRFYEERWKDGGEFALESIDEQRFRGKTYSSLDSQDREALNQTLIRAQIARVDEQDKSALAHMFMALNTAGMKLTPYEILQAQFYGPLTDLASRLTHHPCWQQLRHNHTAIAGAADDRYLILRFLSLHFTLGNGRGKVLSPATAISTFLQNNRDLSLHGEQEILSVFEPTMCTIAQTIGPTAFYSTKKFHYAVYDAVTLGLSARLARGPLHDLHAVPHLYSVLRDELRTATRNRPFPAQRLKAALEIGSKVFGALP